MARNYVSPPIVQAIIEIKFAIEIDDEKQAKLLARFSSDFPLNFKQVHNNVTVNLQEGVVANTQSVVTHKIDATEKPYSYLIAPKSLAVVNAAPYLGWDGLEEYFKSLVEEDRRINGFRKITRIGVRYVNRIDLALKDQSVDYEDFVNLRINLPDDFSPIHNYMLAFQFSIDELNAGATVQSAVVAPAIIDHMSFVLDIDVFREADPPQKTEHLIELLRQLRLEKNRLFETFVTDKARDLFDAR